MYIVILQTDKTYTKYSHLKGSYIYCTQLYAKHIDILYIHVFVMFLYVYKEHEA